MRTSLRWITVGGILLVIGWLILLAEVIEIIPKYIWLSFVSYAVSLVGFIVGIVGIVMDHRIGRKD